MSVALEPVTDATVGFLNKLFAHTPLQNVPIRRWARTRWPDDQPRAATVVLKYPGARASARLLPGRARSVEARRDWYAA